MHCLFALVCVPREVSLRSFDICRRRCRLRFEWPLPQLGMPALSPSWRLVFPCAATNKTKNKILFTKLTAQYKDKSGTYQSFDSVFSGRKTGYYNYSLQEFKNIDVEPQTKADFVVAGKQKITSKQYTNHRRSHQATFPDPLELRFVLTDMTNNSFTLDFKYANPPLELVTREQKQDISDFFWLQLDDTELEYRAYAAIKKNDAERRLELSLPNSSGSSSVYLSNSSLHSYAFKAKQENKTEWPLDVSYTSENGSGTATALVDLEKEYVYAIQIELKTTTGQCMQQVLIPKL